MLMQQKTNTYQLPILLAITLHILLLMILLFDVNSESTKPLAMNVTAKPVKIVQATVVDQEQVAAEINRIKQVRSQQRDNELARQNKLKSQAEAAKKLRIKEQKKLVALTKQAERAKQKQIQAQKTAVRKLANLKKQQAEQAKRIARIKKQELKRLQTIAKRKKEDVVRKAKAMAEQKDRAEKAKKLAQAKTSAVRQSAVQSEIDKYKSLLISAISNRWIVPEGLNPSLMCQLSIRLAPGGTVLSVNIAKSSGNSVLDRSAVAAVYKASPLPVPGDSDAFQQFRQVSLKVRPEKIVQG